MESKARVRLTEEGSEAGVGLMSEHSKLDNPDHSGGKSTGIPLGAEKFDLGQPLLGRFRPVGGPVGLRRFLAGLDSQRPAQGHAYSFAYCPHSRQSAALSRRLGWGPRYCVFRALLLYSGNCLS